jgi:beta-aspartyl-peptidase (threonine type)
MKRRAIATMTAALLVAAAALAGPAHQSSKSAKAAPEKAGAAHPIAIVIHGGAGGILRTDFTPAQDKAYREALTRALHAGYAVLQKGGKSVDAVVAAINVMENSPLFNAGRGAVFTHSGRIQLDASIMDGNTHKAGAVGAVEHVRNPISLARLVMDDSPHVLLVGRGAEDFAMGQGMTLVPQSYFKTKRRFQQIEKVWEKKGAPWNAPSATLPPEHGTVGCVALDRDGHLAAGTSTGGLTNKLDGRVGDSPIIGAGTYADDATCGLSCTGIGEFFQRFLVAYDVTEQMRFKNMTVEQAATYEVHTRLMKMAGPDSGGIIAIDRHGRITCQFNTTGMFRACIDTAGHLSIALYGDERIEPKG